MLTRILVPLCWTLWSVLLVVLLYAMVKVLTERTSSPEAGRGLGVFAVGFLFVLLAVSAFFINMAAKKPSQGGLITMAVVLIWPLFFMVADPLMKAYKARSFASAEASNGDFKDPALKAMAQAVSSNDTATLAQLLKGQPYPPGQDRAGNDLLGYALVAVRDRKGSAAPVRVLLEAGGDPRKARLSTGEHVVNYLIHGGTPDSREAMRLLLEHGADPNVVDKQTGKTPLGEVYNDPEIVRALADHGADIDRIQPDGVPAVVGFIGTQQWESALYLIEKGAKLDVVNSHGLSVDYYLNDWKDGVFGEHPEGWDKVRDAIAKRRAQAK